MDTDNWSSQSSQDLLQEYVQLCQKNHLTESEASRMKEILDIAESDATLEFWINEADHLICHKL